MSLSAFLGGVVAVLALMAVFVAWIAISLSDADKIRRERPEGFD